MIYKINKKGSRIISKNFTVTEATNSRTAKKWNINNSFKKQKQYNSAVLLAEKVLEPLREHFNTPIRVNSWFRSKRLNTLIGGALFSQHVKGEAVDISLYNVKGELSSLFYYIKDNLEFDQLIWEFGDEDNPDWIHVSYRHNRNRKQVLIAYKNIKNKTKYMRGGV